MRGTLDDLEHVDFEDITNDKIVLGPNGQYVASEDPRVVYRSVKKNISLFITTSSPLLFFLLNVFFFFQT